MEKNDRRMLMIGALVVAALLALYLISKRGTSRYTAQVFTGMTAAQATASFTQKTAEIVQELKTKLTDAMQAGKSTEELIAISDTYSGYSCDLNKAFSRFQIENMDNLMAQSPAPAPAPVQAPAPGPK
jgi:ABC-type glutathione transport system ATPase component